MNMKRLLATVGAVALLTGAGLVSAQAAQATQPTYHAAIWEASLNLAPKFPQQLVHDVLTSSTDVHQLDAFATKCGTTYQFDLYADDARTDKLIASGVLNGSEESWPGGDYRAEFSNVFTTAKCGPTLITVPALEVTPPTCAADGSLPWTANPAAQNANGYEFPGEGYRVYINPAYSGPGTYQATIQKVGPGFDQAFPYGTKVTGATAQRLTVLPKLLEQSTDANAPCYLAPPVPDKPAVVPVTTVTSVVDCDGQSATDTSITVTPTFTLVDNVWVEGPQVSSAPVITTRALTDAEIADCPAVVIPPVDPPVVTPPVVTPPVVTPPVVTPVTPVAKPITPAVVKAAVPVDQRQVRALEGKELAVTGNNVPLAAGLTGLAALLAGIGALVIVGIRRRTVQ